jgi:hypothetical protein
VPSAGSRLLGGKQWQEVGSSAGKSGGKREAGNSGGKKRWEEAAGSIRREKAAGSIGQEKSGGKSPVSLPSGPWASNWSCRELPALLIGSCRTWASTGAPAHLLGSHPRRQAFGAVGVAAFLAPSPNNAPTAFWEPFWGRWWRCSNPLSSPTYLPHGRFPSTPTPSTFYSGFALPALPPQEPVKRGRDVGS